MTSALQSALVECRRDAIEPAGSFEQIAARHGIDPHDLCAAWFDDPAREFTTRLRQRRDSQQENRRHDAHHHSA